MKNKFPKKIAFVTFSGSALREKPNFYRTLVEAIEKGCNCKIKHRWFEKGKKQTPKEIYEASLASIREANLFIAEASSNSIGVGQQLAYAIQLKKPVIVCLNEKTNRNASSPFLKGTHSSNVYFIYYTHLNDLKKRLQTVVNSLEHFTLEKFNFLATKKQKEFLLKESKKRNISKSELLRMIVDEWMGSNSYPRELLE